MIEFTTVTGERISLVELNDYFELSSKKELGMKSLIQFLSDFTKCVRFANEYRWNEDYRHFIIND